MNTIRAVLKFSLFAVFSLFTLPVQAVTLCFHRGDGAKIIPYLWFWGVCFFFGIRVRKEGTVYKDGQTMLISNHLSFFDIAVIGRYAAGSFVARGDAKHWPFLGKLADLNQTAYVARSRAAAKADSNAVNSVIESGRNLIIFAEGTSTDGQEVLPFKSSLFSLALSAPNPDLQIQPVSVQVLSVNGKAPEAQEERDIYAWHRDMDVGLFTHWWNFANHRGAEIRLVFHPPFRAQDYDDRKTLAKHCHDIVSNGMITLEEK